MKTLLFILLLFLLALNGVVLWQNRNEEGFSGKPIAACCSNLLPAELAAGALPGALMVLK